MLVESLLGRFVVIRTHTENSIDALEVAVAQFFNDSSGVVAATSHQDGNPSSHLCHDTLLDGAFLLGSEARRFACSSQDAQEVGTIVELVFYQSFQCLEVDAAVGLERSDQSDAQSLKYVLNCHDYA